MTAYDGGSRSEAARIGGVGLQIVRVSGAVQRSRAEWLDRRQGAGALPEIVRNSVCGRRLNITPPLPG